jgi:hypothetical protein
MANPQNNAGYYTLKSFKVKPLLDENLNRDSENSSMPEYVELTYSISDWGIDESLDSPFISGFAVVHESDNLLESVPLLGEEEITVTYEDFYGKSATHKLFLYAIEQVGPESSINDRMMKYTIRFTSVQKLQGDQRSIRKSYNTTKISEIAEDIYNTFMLTGNKDYDKEIEIEETDGEQSLVIPDLRADAAMQFLSRRAYSQKNNTSLYRFFETREKYFFCTPEYLIEKYGSFEGKTEEELNRLNFIYNTVEDNTGPGQRIAQQSVNDVSYGNKVDTFHDMKAGMYRRTVTELDPTTRTRIQRDYDYTNEYQDKEMPEKVKLTHSDTFLNKYMSASTQPEQYLIVDFPQIGQSKGKQDMKKPYQNFYENYTAKPVVNYHFFSNELAFEINGRIELYPGMVINLELYKFNNTVSGNRELDKERSGKYLVTSVSSSFSGESMKQQLVCTKGGLS